MSARESWPGEDAEAPEADDAVEETDADDDAEVVESYADEDTGDEPPLRIAGHDDGELDIPDDVSVLEGEPRSVRRAVGIVIARVNVEVANRMLESALAELERAGVPRESVMVMAVPGAFELPIGAMALAKTRRYSCIVALGDATGSDVIAGEAASGLQLAGLETGIPVTFGVLTDGGDAEARGAEAVRNALEMADLFQQLRATASSK
jgi:6,7-dimethyl-8-ribityllumazine synthase